MKQIIKQTKLELSKNKLTHNQQELVDNSN